MNIKFRLHKILLLMAIVFLGLFGNVAKANAEESKYTHLEENDNLTIQTWTHKFDTINNKWIWSKQTSNWKISSSFRIGSSYLIPYAPVDTGYKPSNIAIVTTSAETDFDPSKGSYSTTPLSLYDQYGAQTYEGGKYTIYPRSEERSEYSWKSLEDILGITHDNVDTKCINIITEQTKIKLTIRFCGYYPESENEESKYKVASDEIKLTYGETAELPKTITSFTGNDIVYNTPNGCECIWQKQVRSGKITKYVNVNNVSELFGNKEDGYVYLYPKYKMITYNITYDNNGGELPENAIKTYQISDEDIILPTPTKEGYEFKGWVLNGQNISNVLKSNTYGDITLVADWNHEPINIILYIDPKSVINNPSLISRTDAWGVSGTRDNQSVYTTTLQGNGDTLSVKIPTLIANGYKFVGWYDNADYNGELMKGNTTYEIPANSDTILYAKWCNHNNTWDDGKITKPATCKETGIKTFTCTVCGETKEETIETTSHKNGIKGEIAATCGKDGYSGDIYCTVCEDEIEKGHVIPATGNHTWNKGEITKAATKDETGIMTYTCTVCNATREDIIPVVTDIDDHSKTEIRNVKKATCKEEGYTGDTYCLIGKELLVKGEIIPKNNNHVYDNGIITKEPTKTSEGIRTYTCTICGETKTEVVEKLPDNPDTPENTDTPSSDKDTESTEALDALDKENLDNIVDNIDAILNNEEDTPNETIHECLGEIEKFVENEDNLKASEEIDKILITINEESTPQEITEALTKINNILLNLQSQVTKREEEQKQQDKEIIITLDGNGITLFKKTISTKFNEKAILPVPTRDGFVFKGWYTDKAGGEKITEETLFTEDITLYAIWEEKQFETPKTTITPSQTVTPSTKDADNPVNQTIVTPSKITKVKAKNIKGKKIKVTWKREATAKTYEIQTSLKKNFKKNVKTYKTTKTSYTIKKLKKNKTYYVRVRGVNDNNVGIWSKTIKIKIKK